MHTHVIVTEKHIREGIKSNCHLCPIALAIREANPEFAEIRVGTSSVQGYYVHQSVSDVTAWFPEFVRDFIYKFDLGRLTPEEMKPFEFDLQDVHYYGPKKSE